MATEISKVCTCVEQEHDKEMYYLNGLLENTFKAWMERCPPNHTLGSSTAKSLSEGLKTSVHEHFVPMV